MEVAAGDVLIADLSRLRFIDAAGARALVRAAARLRFRHAGLVVRGASPLAREVLRICGLDHVALAIVEGHPPGWNPVAEAEAILSSSCPPPEKSRSTPGSRPHRD